MIAGAAMRCPVLNGFMWAGVWQDHEWYDSGSCMLAELVYQLIYVCPKTAVTVDNL